MCVVRFVFFLCLLPLPVDEGDEPVETIRCSISRGIALMFSRLDLYAFCYPLIAGSREFNNVTIREGIYLSFDASET